MKNLIKYTKISLVAILSMATLVSCKRDDYDGLTVVDPVPANAITFPQAVHSNGFAFIDQNAFIAPQPLGDVKLEIQVPQGKSITAIRSVRGQFNKGTYSTRPNASGIISLSPTTISTAAVFPTAFSRLVAPNYTTISSLTGTGSNKVTLNIPLTSIPRGTLAAPAVNDFVRLFIELEFSDGSTALSAEARVWFK